MQQRKRVRTKSVGIFMHNQYTSRRKKFGELVKLRLIEKGLDITTATFKAECKLLNDELRQSRLERQLSMI